MTAVTPLRRAGNAVLEPVPAEPARAGVAPIRPEPTRPRETGPTQTGPVPARLALAPAPDDEAREICAITRATVQAAIEVLAGTRPIHQLARRLDQRCLTVLQHRAALTRRVAARSPRKMGLLHRNASVRSVRACGVTPDVYEASAVVIDELRVRAVAVRLERSKNIWRVTALEIG
ncbi:Rv3235 family protein [Arthrobacter sp. NPDC056691]|uniref:Rv3235 family protein n=1 Tax=Arthrobacter sp. NPDC056691 TaxID=3345913 RepID=UPI00366E251E